MKVTLLGTGTSTGVPVVGCTCAVCKSNDERDIRMRCSAMIETDSTRIVIDCGPDFRQQMLRQAFRPIDGLFITHEHADHVGGIDDLRPYSVFGKVELYAEPHCAEHLEQRLPYCLKDNSYPGVPQLSLHRIAPHDTINIGDLRIQALRVMHGKLPILGFRIGDFAYITDMSSMDESETQQLSGVRTAVINALRYDKHPTHNNVSEAIAFSRKCGFENTIFTHVSHDIGLHKEVQEKLPSGFILGYDGMTIQTD